MQIIVDNFRSEASHPFLDYHKLKLPLLHIIPYQCSPLSTSQGIEKVFETAEKAQTGANQRMNKVPTYFIVLMDEIGLAEHSPNMPLKVLHKLLEDPQVSFVGISNWALDPAKMNRGVRNVK